MSRPNEGWKVRPPKTPGGCHTVRFTFAGRQVDLGTGERGYTEACAVAGQKVAEYIARGGAAPKLAGHGPVTSSASLGPLAASWIEDLGTTIAEGTALLYALQMRAHLVPWFKTLDRVTAALAPDYYRDRLGHVQRPTVVKERTCLRAFVAWAHQKGLTDVKPDDLPTVPKRAVGVVHRNGHREPQSTEPAEVRAILHGLPARDRFGQLCRLLYVFYYETGLRPKTVHSLGVPDNWRPGSSELRLAKLNDKARFARKVPLSRAARLVLHWVTEGGKRRGSIFGDRPDHRISFKAAAVAVLGERGEHIQFYDMRRAMVTHDLDAGAPVTGTAFRVGHKHISTTAGYARPGPRAAELAIKARRAHKESKP